MNAEPPEGGLFVDYGEPLPASYGEDTLEALVRDPESLFVYWDLSASSQESGPLVLRLHCVSEDWTRETAVTPEADNWYIPVEPERRYVVEIGALSPDGVFRSFAHSREVTVAAWNPQHVRRPRDAPDEGQPLPARPVQQPLDPISSTAFLRGK